MAGAGITHCKRQGKTNRAMRMDGKKLNSTAGRNAEYPGIHGGVTPGNHFTFERESIVGESERRLDSTEGEKNGFYSDHKMAEIRGWLIRDG